jgi:acyl carrier protein
MQGAKIEDIAEIVRAVTKDKTAVINENTIASDVRNWDSLTHIFIIAGIEKKFKVKFKAAEAQKAKNVGELLAIVNSKLA